MKKKLKIAQLAPPWLAVPPKKYGGTELIVSHLTEELTKRGHNVTLFASADSKTRAKLVSSFPKALYWKGTSWHDLYGLLFHTLTCFEKAENFDIIHNHSAYLGLCFSQFTKTKVVTTYHGSLHPTIKEKGAKYKILKKFKNSYFVSISNSQRKTKDLKLNFVATVYNGIDVKKFDFNESPKKHLIWMGRITPKKGVLESIEIAKKLKLPLKIAAKIDKNWPPDVEFYEKRVKPLIDGKKIRYIGEIGGYKNKSNFLKNALALLNPIKWEEPFGLVMTEAMACGTPVIAFGRGSVPEVIKNGKTGFICKPNDINSMIRAVKKIYQMPTEKYIKMRHNCRKHVEENFTAEKMVNEYEKVYYKILKSKK